MVWTEIAEKLWSWHKTVFNIMIMVDNFLFISILIKLGNIGLKVLGPFQASCCSQENL